MKSFLGSFFVLLSLHVVGQDTNQITIGHTDSLHSVILNEDRVLRIYNPSPAGTDNKERYPVLILLDAEQHFSSTVGMIQQLRGRWPGILVVGITNTDRNRDLTPANDEEETSNGTSSGGGDRFMDFIGQELIPYIEQHYPASPYRLFSGHSLGGLMVTHTFLNNPGLFNAYIAIDPSLWWDDMKLVEASRKDYNTAEYDTRSLFIARAKNMPPGMEPATAMTDTTEYTVLFRSVASFVANLGESSETGFRWKAKFYPEETHGTVQLNGQYDALKFMFDYYQFRTSLFELHPDMDIDSVLSAHFQKISRRFGYPVLPSENLINNLGYTCMGLKKWAQAEAFFKQNIENHQESANCFDSMGDFYQATSDLRKAMENYSKALSLGNDDGTRQKLEYLKSIK